MSSPPDGTPVDGAATAEEVAAAPPDAPPRRRTLRWLWPILFLAGLTAVLWTPVVQPRCRQMMVLWHAMQAEQQLLANELDGALASAEKSVGWASASLPQGELSAALAKPDEALTHSPKLATALRLRAEVRQARHDLEGSLADFNALIAINPYVARSYQGRSHIAQRLGRHREAIDDATAAIGLQREGDPEPLNNRAYARAIANVELDEALEDIERALAAMPASKLVAPLLDPRPSYLDTRAFVLYRLGRYEPALADMEAAMPPAEAALQQSQDQKLPAGAVRRFRHALAVMLHHRGSIHEKLGHAEQAEADLRRGQEMGYDPDRGVF